MATTRTSAEERCIDAKILSAYKNEDKVGPKVNLHVRRILQRHAMFKINAAAERLTLSNYGSILYCMHGTLAVFE